MRISVSVVLTDCSLTDIRSSSTAADPPAAVSAAVTPSALSPSAACWSGTDVGSPLCCSACTDGGAKTCRHLDVNVAIPHDLRGRETRRQQPNPSSGARLDAQCAEAVTSGVSDRQGHDSQWTLTSRVRTIRRVFCCISFSVGGSSASLLPSAAAAWAASSPASSRRATQAKHAAGYNSPCSINAASGGADGSNTTP